MDEEDAQVPIPALADVSDPVLVAARCDARCQTKPSGEVSRGTELTAVTYGSHKSRGRPTHRPLESLPAAGLASFAG